MKEWGDGKSIATTSEEATDIWLQVKAKEVKNISMQSILEKYIREQKESDEKEDVTPNNESFEVEPNEIESNEIKNDDETSNDSSENVKSIEINVTKSEELVQTFTSDDSILINNEDCKINNVSIDVPVDEHVDEHVDKSVDETSSPLDKLIEEEKKRQLKPVIEKKNSTPILAKAFVSFVESLGLNSVTNGTAISSATLGFAAGALVMALLQKIRSR